MMKGYPLYTECKINNIPIFIFDKHNMALPIWGKYASKYGALHLFTIDSHTDTHSAFAKYLRSMLCDLYLRGFIINKKELIDTIKTIGISFSKWLIDLDSFDYSLFDVSWLNRCYPSLLKKIADNKKTKNGISKRVAEEHEKGRIDRRTMRKFFCLFMNESNI